MSRSSPKDLQVGLSHSRPKAPLEATGDTCWVATVGGDLSMVVEQRQVEVQRMRSYWSEAGAGGEWLDCSLVCVVPTRQRLLSPRNTPLDQMLCHHAPGPASAHLATPSVPAIRLQHDPRSPNTVRLCKGRPLLGTRRFGKVPSVRAHEARLSVYSVVVGGELRGRLPRLRADWQCCSRTLSMDAMASWSTV